MSKVRDTLFELLENGGLDAQAMAEMLIKWTDEDSLLECLRQNDMPLASLLDEIEGDEANDDEVEADNDKAADSEGEIDVLWDIYVDDQFRGRLYSFNAVQACIAAVDRYKLAGQPVKAVRHAL